jgi:hypothetical protein
MMKRRTSGARRGTSWASVCRMALHVEGRFLARLKEDGQTMAIRMEFADRDVLLEMDPTVFYLTDHYRPYQAVLVRLEKAPPSLVRQVLRQAWRFQAPRALVAGGGAARRGSTADRTQRGAVSRPRRRRGRTTTR